MILKNKIFRFSSLCIVGVLAIVSNKFIFDNGVYTEEVNNEEGVSAQDNGTDNALTYQKFDFTVPYVLDDEQTKMFNDEIVRQEQIEQDNKERAELEKKISVDIQNPVPNVDYVKLLQEAYTKYNNVAFANVENYLNIRKSPSTSAGVVGKLQENYGCNITETVKGDDGKDWYKVTSGSITGYVAAEYMITGQAAIDMFAKVGRVVAISTTDSLNVRKGPSTDTAQLYTLQKEEELEVKEILKGWYRIDTGMGENENDATSKGYVSADYTTISFEFVKAYSDDEAAVTGVSSIRQKLVAEARTHLGGKYKWGGTSYSTGVDCSGFMQRLYKDVCGINIERNSAMQCKVNGTFIERGQLRPGDLVFYATNGNVSHVAMFIGNGKIIHAASTRSGIRIANMDYNTPYRYKKILND